MVVCAHGDVAEYCSAHGMVIVEELVGEIEEYEGVCPVIVTDQVMSENEFYALQLRMLRRGIELVSVVHKNDEKAAFTVYLAGEKRQKHGGRKRFSDGRVIARILELHDAGKGLREISEDSEVRHPDGRKLSISTISLIIKDRKKYEKA